MGCSFRRACSLTTLLFMRRERGEHWEQQGGEEQARGGGWIEKCTVDDLWDDYLQLISSSGILRCTGEGAGSHKMWWGGIDKSNVNLKNRYYTEIRHLLVWGLPVTSSSGAIHDSAVVKIASFGKQQYTSKTAFAKCYKDSKLFRNWLQG